MKSTERKRFDEGMLLTAVLCLVFALCVGVYAARLPRKITAEPIHSITRSLPMPVFEPLDVNSADEAMLAELPGIGGILAERIAAYRRENGPFACADDLLRVEGIGEKKLEAIRDLIVCGNG